MVVLQNPAPRGWRTRGWIPGIHRGIDYGWYKANRDASQDVVAALGGRVIEVYTGGGWNKGFGNRVVIDHGYGVRTTYNHFSYIAVRVGQDVAAGQYLGEMGSTGDTGKNKEVHLHFELQINLNRVDPAPYFTNHLPGIPLPKGPSTFQRETRVRANRRAQPTTQSADLGNDLNPNVVGNFVGYRHGEHVNGSPIWLKGINGHFFHISSFKDQSIAGMPQV